MNASILYSTLKTQHKTNGNKKIKLTDVLPQRQNASKHTERGMGMLGDSIQKDGWIGAITVAADGETFDGSARIETGVAAGFDDAIVIESDGTKPIIHRRTDIPNADDPRAKRLGIAANRVPQVNLEWNPDILAELAPEEIKGMFSDKELAEILSQTGVEPPTTDAEVDIDKAAELQQKWQVATGEVIQIGRHRLMCGDSTKAEDLDHLCASGKVEMMFTDPPYGVGYDGGHFHSGDVNIKRARPKLVADESSEVYSRFLPVVLPFVNGPCYMWFADREAGAVFNAVAGAGAEIHAMLIWNKTNATYAAMNAQYKQRHEPCLYFKPKGSTLRWIGASDECTVWDVKRDASNEWHPTQKPIELATRALRNHAAKSVLDVFCGSGSTMVAAENAGRTCYAMDVAPEYAATTLERMTKAFPNLKIERVDKARAVA